MEQKHRMSFDDDTIRLNGQEVYKYVKTFHTIYGWK